MTFGDEYGIAVWYTDDEAEFLLNFIVRLCAKKAVVMLLLRVTLISLGAFGVLDTIFVSFLCNTNLGVLMPGILGLPLLLIGLFLPKWTAFFTCGFGRLLKWLLIAGYGLFLLLFIVTSIRLHTAAVKKPPTDADAILYWVAGSKGRQTNASNLRKRLDTAIGYLKSNPRAIAILSGGKGVGETISEAVAMARYFQDKGVLPPALLRRTLRQVRRKISVFPGDITGTLWL